METLICAGIAVPRARPRGRGRGSRAGVLGRRPRDRARAHLVPGPLRALRPALRRQRKGACRARHGAHDHGCGRDHPGGARALLALPRAVGVHRDTGKTNLAGIGRYGPWLRHGATYLPLPDVDVLYIGLNRAVALVHAKRT